MFIFYKTEIQMVILSCLVCLNLNWIKSYNTILITIKFCYAWKCIISWVVCRSVSWHLRRKPALMFLKILLGLQDPHNQVKCRQKKYNYFLNFSPITFFNILLCLLNIITLCCIYLVKTEAIIRWFQLSMISYRKSDSTRFPFPFLFRVS